MTTTHDQTTHDAPRDRRGARERLAVGAGLHGGGPGGKDRPVRVCDYDWRAGTWHIKQLIKCAARRWDSPGTPDQAVALADCESNLNPLAYGSAGYAGLFQQSTRYWPVRADQWGQDDRSVFNGRANIIVSIRMAHASGSWSSWAGCG